MVCSTALFRSVKYSSDLQYRTVQYLVTVWSTARLVDWLARQEICLMRPVSGTSTKSLLNLNFELSCTAAEIKMTEALCSVINYHRINNALNVPASY